LLMVIIASSLFSFPKAEAHAAGFSLSSFTSTAPTIDGIIGATEWANAAKVDFSFLFDRFGGGTIYVMNDDKNLYIAVKVADNSLTGRNLELDFDNDHRGIRATGDDIKTLDQNSFYDFYVSAVPPDSYAIASDETAGGTVDGTGKATSDGTFNYFEFSLPLCSSDISHDFCVSAGGTLGFNLFYGYNLPGVSLFDTLFGFNTADGFGHITTSTWGDIVIAHSNILSDGPSCNSIGGIWNSATSTCTIQNFTVNSGETLTISTGVELIVRAGLTINPGGTVSNSGTITVSSCCFSGLINNFDATIINTGTISIESTGVFVNNGITANSGTITNNSAGESCAGCAGSGIINGGTINNTGTINNNSGSTFDNTSGNINDNCGGIINNIGTITGNQVVNIPCSTPLSITAPPNITVNADPGLCSSTGISLGTATTSGGTPTIIVSNNAPATFPIGPTTVTWNATDSSTPTPQTVNTTQTVTVIDNQLPTISAPLPVIVTVGIAGSAIGTASATDNCPGVIITSNAPATFATPGSTTVTWTATDASGNTANATQLVTVLTPAQSVQNLINVKESMNLDKGIATSLDAKLSAALESLNSGQNSVAKNLLSAFINQVNAQTDKTITQAQATQLIQDVQNILNAIH